MLLSSKGLEAGGSPQEGELSDGDLKPCSLPQWREVAREPASGALRAFWQPSSLGHPVRPGVSNMPGPYLRLDRHW